MSKATIDPGWRTDSTLTSVRLPDGSESGGVLIDRDGEMVFVLFADEDLAAGDRIEIAQELTLTVAGVEHGTLSGQRVTILDVGGARPRH